MARRIVVFGGTFDPVHNGHLIVARALAEARGFERITLMPTGRPPHKPAPVAGAEDRLAMLRLAAAGEDLFEISELELRRPGASYTIDTLVDIQRAYGSDAEIYWVIGADMLEDLPKWRRIEEVLSAAKLLVATRPPWDERLETLLSATAAAMSKGLHFFAESIVRTPLVEISSTEIRERVILGQSVKYLIPDAVDSYIARTRLYASVLGDGRRGPAGACP